MRLALLCDDTRVGEWLAALSGECEHDVCLAVALTPAMSAILRGTSGIRLTSHWEDLLASRDFDAILVGGSDPQILDAIKQFAAASQPLLYLPQADQGSTFIYELSLIRDDNNVAMLPAFWHRCDPALIPLRERIHNGSKDRPRLVQFDRVFGESAGSSLIAQAVIDRALLFDVDLLRWLIGDYDQVIAVRTGTGPEGAMTQSVKLSGCELCEATWNASAGPSDSCRMTIHFESGRIQVESDPVSGEWVVIPAYGERSTGNRQIAIRNLVDRFAQAITKSVGPSRSNVPVDWPELVKAFETVDATHRSVARRRTIELHFEPMSEQAIFKTQMTAMGCGVLVATFLLVLVYLGIAGTVPLPGSLLLILRGLVFAPLAIFLLLQVLYPLAKPATIEQIGDDTAVH